MGAGSSSPEDIGDEVFRFAEKFLQIEDNEKLEKVTGMVISGSESNNLKYLLQNDQKELERRLIESASLVQNNHCNSSSTQGSICGKIIEDVSNDQGKNDENIKGNTNLQKKKEELIMHFDRLYPGLDSAKVSDELLKLTETELDHVISTPYEFENFIKMCSVVESHEGLRKGPTSTILDTEELLENFKQEQFELFSKSELNEEDIDSLIGNHLFKRVNELHPSKAQLITGILMGLEKDIVLQLLASAPILHQNIASVISELRKNGKINQRDIALMQEELGDVIFSLMEKDVDQETAGRVTGMLLEMDIVFLHQVLADEYLFRKKTKEALNAT